MVWEIETEPEVTDWYLGLSADDRDIVAVHIDLLAAVIVLLTVFHKQRNNEDQEVTRARKALDACRTRHTP